MSNTPHITYLEQTLFGLPFFATSQTDAVQFILKSVEQGEFLTVATPNPEQIVQAADDQKFSESLQTFNVFLPDGQGIVWASKVFRKPIQERIAGVDVVAELLKEMKTQGRTGLIVGGHDYLIKNTPENSSKSEEGITEIEVRGTKLFWTTDFNRKNHSDSERVVSWIKKHKPTFVFVALGAPSQEEWIVTHRQALQTAGVRCAMVVGGAFDVLTDQVQRAPESIQQAGLEWGWRLLKEPWRWKRQLRLVRFAKMVFSKLY